MNMMRFRIVKILLACVVTGLPVSLMGNDNLRMWYRTPASHWEEALLLGNGRIGAMVYGDPYEECIQLNEATFWSGSPHANYNGEGAERLPEIQKLQFEGHLAEAKDLIEKHMMSKRGHGMMYQPVGNLRIKFLDTSVCSEYKRMLDLRTGLCVTSFSKNGVDYTQECFVSYPDQVIAIRITASEKERLNVELTMDTPQKGGTESVSSHVLAMDITSPSHEGGSGGVRLKTYAYLDVEGGMALNVAGGVKVKRANALTVYVAMRSNYQDYKTLSAIPERAKNDVEAALNLGYEALKRRHVKDFSYYADRSSFELPVDEYASLPTDLRIKNYAKDRSLPALFYHFGRYLLISGSRLGGQPLTLQGLWNGDIRPEWDSKYTININTQMNYWPAEATNLSEMHLPLMEMLKDLSLAGRETATEMYGALGWVAHHNTDLWRTTGMVDGATWGAWPYGGVWLSMHIWYHYLYTGDIQFLHEYYPVLKGAAEFLCSFLKAEPEHGWMVGAPSISPENTPKEVDGYARINYGCTLDNQLAYDLFNVILCTERILNVKDGGLSDKVKKLIKRLPPMQIGKYGQLQEWMWDWDSNKENQSHISHLYGFFPSALMSYYRTPLLAAAVRNSLIQRNEYNNTSWGNAWRVNEWARLHDGKKAFQFLQYLMRPADTASHFSGSMPNLFSSIMPIDGHSCFQIDANLGLLSGIVEMLLQSHDGAIDLLPALPDFWPEGKISGLRTQGGFIVDMEWKDARISRLEITSTLGNVCKVRYCGQNSLTPVSSIKRININRSFGLRNSTYKLPMINRCSSLEPLAVPLPHVIAFDTKKGETYVFVDE